MKFDIEAMFLRASMCESKTMYIECAITNVMVDYYFDEFLKAASTSSVTRGDDSEDNQSEKRSIIDGDGSVCSEWAVLTPHPPQADPLPFKGEGNNPRIRISKKHRTAEIDGCRIYFIRFDDVIAKRSFDDGGVIWDYIVEEDE